MTYRLKDQKNNAAFYEISDKREIKPLTHYEEYMIWWKKSIDKFINFMDEYLSLTNIVVNVPYFNDQILYSNGKIEKYKEDKYEIPENEEVYSTPTDTSPILYIPSVIGINLARLLGRKCSGHIYSR